MKAMTTVEDTGFWRVWRRLSLIEVCRRFEIMYCLHLLKWRENRRRKLAAEDKDSRFIWSGSKLPPDYTATHPWGLYSSQHRESLSSDTRPVQSEASERYTYCTNSLESRALHVLCMYGLWCFSATSHTRARTHTYTHTHTFALSQRTVVNKCQPEITLKTLNFKDKAYVGILFDSQNKQSVLCEVRKDFKFFFYFNLQSLKLIFKCYINFMISN